MNIHYKQYIHRLRYYLQKTYFNLLNRYKKLNKQQRIILFSGIGLITTLLLILLFTPSHTKKPKHLATYSLEKQTQTTLQTPPAPKPQPQVIIQKVLEKEKQATEQRYQHVNQQLQSIQSGLSTVATQDAVNKLQQSVDTTNPQLLGKVDSLQATLKKIEAQSQANVFVSPTLVTKYFQLVAIQIFSDGMRAIIDVANHQAILSANEICPACRGWTLHSMDFANQSAVFKNQHNQYVKLTAN